MTRALVTNDDGVHAPGIATLAACARAVFDEVVVVAPDGDRSAISQAITLHSPLRYSEVADGVFAASGTPVDCVLLGLGHVLLDHPPDMILSGINRGPNIGHDVHYSGTVAAAREGVMQGIPSLAFSLAGRGRFPFGDVAADVTELLRWALTADLAPDTLLNVNLPCPAAGEARPLRERLEVTRLGHRFYENEMLVRDDPRGKPYLWIGGEFPEMHDVPGSDCNAIREGRVSVTPLTVDATAHAAVGALAAALAPDPSDQEPS